MRHVDKGVTCTAPHGNAPSCIQCYVCQQFIRPEDMEGPCSGHAPKWDEQAVMEKLLSRWNRVIDTNEATIAAQIELIGENQARIAANEAARA